MLFLKFFVAVGIVFFIFYLIGRLGTLFLQIFGAFIVAYLLWLASGGEARGWQAAIEGTSGILTPVDLRATERVDEILENQ